MADGICDKSKNINRGELMKKKIIRWLPVIIWMIVIFIFSSQNGSESGNNNRFVIEFLRHIGLNLDKILGSNSDFYVRKLAHMTEYFILFMFIYRALNKDFNFNKSAAFSIIIVFLYASSDEYHQSFVPGRGPSFRDVLIDTCGGIIAFLTIMMARSILHSNKAKS